jgi:hypothetical protein
MAFFATGASLTRTGIEYIKYTYLVLLPGLQPTEKLRFLIISVAIAQKKGATSLTSMEPFFFLCFLLLSYGPGSRRSPTSSSSFEVQ